MVWCARESADFEPGDNNDNAMQLSRDYGWIHYDRASDSWHTVTGYQLGRASQPAETTTTPVSAALWVDHRALTDALVEALSKVTLEVRNAPAAPAAPAAPDDTFLDFPLSAALVERDIGARLVTPQQTAAGHRAAVPRSQPPTPSPPPTPAPPPSVPTDPAAWDADHKRDGDRDDTQLSLENTRWDMQHTLDNNRWDTRHTLDNTRWDTQHALDNTRWDTRHTLDNARWDAMLALKRAREDAALAADMSLLSAVHGAYVSVAQGSLDRAVQRATYVTTAAGVIGTVYTAVLAARYTISHQAPARSILPALFIGAAVAFSTWYMAFLRGHTREQQFLLSGAGGKIAETRLLTFMEWTFSSVLARAWSLRASVISLGLALTLLPIGLVQFSSGTVWLLGLLALLILVLWLAGEAYVARNGPGVEAFMIRQKKKPPRLAPKPPTLPPPPTGGLSPTGAPDYGMRDAPPQRPSRADDDNPPEPPAVAAEDPPAAPRRANGADPPAPPAVAAGTDTPEPLPRLSAGPRPPAPDDKTSARHS